MSNINGTGSINGTNIINGTNSINGTNNINGTDNTENTVKTGLVLEGGGMRGMYTDGILDVFLDQGLSFDGVIGVSAGAIHGSSFVSGKEAGAFVIIRNISEITGLSVCGIWSGPEILRRCSSAIMICRRSLIFTITMPSTVLKRSFMQSAAMWRLESRSISALQI